MKRTVPLLLATVLVLLLGGTPASAAPGWRSAQPVVAGAAVPVPLGAVGDVAFWAPNRGMLVTAGNDAVAPGLFAYDGTGWYRYATVCGGTGGRIAWAGPNDFWTISDQQAGQERPGGGGQAAGQRRSLCHFVDGAVVASYAEPESSPEAYLPMTTAACSGPSDCWFGGDRLPAGVNTGAFHLHWDGTALTAIPSRTVLQPELADPARAVADLAYQGGRLFESVTVQRDDDVPTESTTQPYRLHEIVADGSSPFTPQFPARPLVYGPLGVVPSDLDGFRLSGDATQLWGAAGTVAGKNAAVTVVRRGATGWAQVTLADPDGIFGSRGRVADIAADPGTDAAWLASIASDDAQDVARVTRIHADGSTEPSVLLPGAGEGLGRKGNAVTLACPATGQCWMATARGWLFHLGDDPAPDADPLLHRIVTYRPPDNSVPVAVIDTLPDDVSGANPPPSVEVVTPPTDDGGDEPPAPKALVYRVAKPKLLGRSKTTLELAFSLRAKARVQLVGLRGKRVVAHSARTTLKPGRHRIRMRVVRKRWPQKLDLRAKAVVPAAKPVVPAGKR